MAAPAGDEEGLVCTARDLALVALSMPSDRTVAQGDLSLALAGAEAIDLLKSGALSMDRDHLMPGPRWRRVTVCWTRRTSRSPGGSSTRRSTSGCGAAVASSPQPMWTTWSGS